MMKGVTRTMGVLSLFLAGCGAGKALPNAWIGQFRFVEQVPGTIPRIWFLDTRRGEGGVLDVQGTQSALSVRCSVKADAHQAQVYAEDVDAPPPGAVTGVGDRPRKRDLLFTMRRTGEKLITEWGSIKPYYSLGNFSRVNCKPFDLHERSLLAIECDDVLEITRDSSP